MFNRRKAFLSLRWAVTDSLLTGGAFLLAYLMRQHLPGMREFYFESPLFGQLLFGVVATWLVAGLAIGAYRVPTFTSQPRVASLILKQALWAGAAMIGLLYLLKMGAVSRLFMLLFVAINTLMLLAGRLVGPIIARAPAWDAGAKKHYVIVGTGDEAASVARLVKVEGGPYAEVLGFVREGEGTAVPMRRELESAVGTRSVRIWELDELTQLLKVHVVDEVIFAVDWQRMASLERVFESCEEEGVKVRWVVNFFPNMVSQVSLDRLSDLPLLTFVTTPDNEYLLFVKRMFDVTVATAMALVFALPSLMVIIAIRISSLGPVLFRQQRCGLNGRVFTLYKFRSMFADAAERRHEMAALNEMDGPVFKIAKDPRITPVGRFLRKFAIDEWPQLLNVLKGDMSLVGPRPPLPQEVQQYKQWQRRRLRMRPGLTCLWVLEGQNRLDFLSWMKADMHYIDHWSLALDLRILLQTIPHVLSGKGI
jgi:exopolysaccharide biosynthesis polyprenyl glycosylphosphotransferase